MTSKTREKKITDLLNLEEKGQKENVNLILQRKNRIVIGAVLSELASLSQVRGAYAYFVEGNVAKMKQNFYVASKLALASLVEEGGRSFNTTHDFFYALLSDNSKVIELLAKLETSASIQERNNPLRSTFHLEMLQLAIRDEHEALQKKIKKMADHGKNPWRDLCAIGQDFYSLLLRRDKDGLEKLIKREAVKQEGWPHLEDFLSEGSTLRAKLCWLKGIPVQIESPLVPMDLMPIEPLPYYDDEYDFLKPGWTPPAQGLMGSLRRWFK